MSQFDDMFGEVALPQLMEMLGDAATYRVAVTEIANAAAIAAAIAAGTTPPALYAGVSLTAIIGAEETQVAGEGRGRRISTNILISTDSASAYGGVAAPARSDTITKGADVWVVERVITAGGGFARLAAYKQGAFDG